MSEWVDEEKNRCYFCFRHELSLVAATFRLRGCRGGQ